MAENLTKRPPKGILKTSSSFEQQEAQRRLQDIKWDEMNILQTLHPPDKDYGHMKIEEPKTPYSYYKDELDAGSDREMDALDAEVLAKKIALGSEQLPKAMMDEEEDESEEDENETEEEREKRNAFESKRKIHYNEFYAVKLARKLMQQDNEDDDEEDADLDETDEGQKQDSANSSKATANTTTTTTTASTTE